MWKEFGDPPLDHSCSLFTLTEPVAKFNTDINPNWMRFRRLVKVKMLMMMEMNVTEDNGVATARHLDRRFWATEGWRCWSRDDFGHDHINGCL